MKLQTRFVQLPLQFDAERLAAEIGAQPDSAWRPHPQGFPGNDFLPLISAHGEPQNESFGGPMRPTPHLEHCPYLVDTLASLGAALGRTRLMRLTGHAEVSPHFDVHYYWRERMRVHVPIVTQPTVRFICADEEVNMRPGECWIFDTWSQHRVINDAEHSRVHLVADTVGGEGFWELAGRGRSPRHPSPPGWAARRVEPFGAALSQLDFESTNIPVVMTPWEIGAHIQFLLAETDPRHPSHGPTARATARFLHVWRSLWSTFGERREGWPRYRKALDGFARDLRAARAETLKFGNGGDFFGAAFAHIVAVGLADRTQDDGRGERRDAAAAREPSTVA
jgi:hypothetical protein